MAEISVIIPCYNVSNYIGRCLKALENQTFKDFSVILVDDCSTDNTLEVLEDYKKNTPLSIEIIKNEQNSGPAASRNRGILAAKTEYIAFCDGDDWYDDVFLGGMISLIKQNNADLSLCGYKVVDNCKVTSTRPIVDSDCVMDFKKALTLESDSLCMLVVKSEIMKNTLLPDLRNGEDVAVVPLLMSKAKSIAVTKECYYNYYRRSGSASQKPNEKVVNSLLWAYGYLKSNFPSGNEAELEFLGIKNMLYPSLISLFSYSYNTKKADEILNNFESENRNWAHNAHLKSLPSYKRIVLKCAEFRWYLFIRLIAGLRNKLTN